MIRDLCFEIIEACPNNCKFCSSNANINKRKIIKLEDFKRVIDYFYNSVGIEELSLSGGEPFLHPNLLQMVEYASNLGIRTVIFTSGVIRKVQEDMEYRQYLIEAMNKRLETIKKYDSGNIELINQVKRYYLQKIEPCTYTNISRERLFELKEAGLNKIVFDYQAQSHDIDCYLMGRDENQQQIFSESLFEASVSGLDVSVGSLIDLNLVGSDFVTGGIFGPEAGITATFILLASIGILLFIDKKRYFSNKPLKS